MWVWFCVWASAWVWRAPARSQRTAADACFLQELRLLPVQCGAAAAYSLEGRKQINELVAFYMNNARLLREGLTAAGFQEFGGINAPYVWLKTPGETSSWDFFDELLEKSHIVGTPGSGFGAAGEGYFRLSAFNSLENTFK